MTYNEFWEAILPIMLFLAFTVPMNIAIVAIIDTVKEHKGMKWGTRNHKEES